MKKYYILVLALLLFCTVFYSCSDKENDYIPVSPVNVDLSLVPYPKLSDYKFFEGDIKLMRPSLNVIPYEPASSLFTDYAHKKRFVWMPTGVKATFDGEGKTLNLPVGAALIKTFYYDNVQNITPIGATRIIETRIMIKKASGWIFAEYVWNADQTEAFLDMAGSSTAVEWKDENNIIRVVDNYRIPSAQQCMTCHKYNEQPIPIGIKPQNLNNNYNYSTGVKNQLAKWIEIGYLDSTIPQNISATVDYSDVSQPLELRVRSYLDINCAHCHQLNSHCDYRPMRFAFSETNDLANMGVCVSTQDMANFPSAQSKIVTPNNVNRSMLFYRLNTDNESFRMPLLGRTEIHTEGIALIQEWINSLSPCP